ncbi:replication initiator protein [Apis mellifera associated microvirus 22]|nr:replication initiator protein [Apis mellifera associated microvirus 22]
MRCTRPMTVGFQPDGKTLCWSKNHFSKEYPTFQLPCGKCISCRLEYSRQWAVRCVHEAQMHPENSFITLTYEKLKSEKLDYTDFQKFMKRLRKSLNQPVGCFVTGEYGEKNKRPHWHAIIFNWRPTDCIYKYSNDRGDKIYSSSSLDSLWDHGITEVGSVTFESAGYCARYAAKKLVHGSDQSHEFHPISKKSSKHAIGKKFLERYWENIFNLGSIVLPNGETCAIPRYYEKWLKQHQPAAWQAYTTKLKLDRQQEAERIETKKKQEEYLINLNRPAGSGPQISRDRAREKILEQKFENLQKHLKL